MDEEAGRVGCAERGESELAVPGTGLRRATHLKSTNKTGYNGVSWDERMGKWRACYRLRGRTIHLGHFDDVHDAGIAASDFRLQHADEIAASYEVGRRNKSKTVKAHKAKLSAEEKRRIALKGHATRRGQLLSSNVSGYQGVSWDARSKRWRVIVRDPQGKRKRLGSYMDVDEAGIVAEAYRSGHARVA